MLCSAATHDAKARDLTVGAARVLKLPSQAATVALAGDTIRIDPGTYADCAVWRASRLTIEAAGSDVVLTGPICFDQGIFITVGHDITVRGLTFAGARGRYHNAAGIRGAGDNLTVEDSRFLDNENGILAGGSPDSVLRVLDSEFRGNGSCEGACAHGVYAGQPMALLDVERCRFSDTHFGHHIKSRARATRVIGNRITDGAEGNSSYLIELPNGGDALIQDNVLQKGPHSDNPGVVISIGIEGVTNPTRSLVIRANRFTSDLSKPTLFVRNSTTTAADLEGNVLTGQVVPLQGPGVVQ
jgi:nitrous oxidase accessory protein NosD